jgi:hypothetical protein
VETDAKRKARLLANAFGRGGLAAERKSSFIVGRGTELGGS